jgi:hypothetical protein
VSALSVQLGKALAPALSLVVKGITTLTNALTYLLETFPRITTVIVSAFVGLSAFLVLTGVIKLTALAVTYLATSFGSLQGVMTIGFPIYDKIVGMFFAVGGAAKRSAASLALMVKEFIAARIASKAYNMEAKASLLAMTGTVFKKNAFTGQMMSAGVDSSKFFTKGFAGTLKGFGKAIPGALKNLFTFKWAKMFTGLAKGAGALGMFTGKMGMLFGIVTKIAALLGTFSGVGLAIAAGIFVLTAAWEGVERAIGKIWQGMLDLARPFEPIIEGVKAMYKIFTGAQITGEELAKWKKIGILNFVTSIAYWFGELQNSSAWSGLITVWEGIKDIFVLVGTAIGNVLGFIGDAIGTIFRSFANLFHFMTGVYKFITGDFSGGWAVMKEAARAQIENLMGFLASAVSRIWENIMGIAKPIFKIFSGIGSIISSALGLGDNKEFIKKGVAVIERQEKTAQIVRRTVQDDTDRNFDYKTYAQTGRGAEERKVDAGATKAWAQEVAGTAGGQQNVNVTVQNDLQLDGKTVFKNQNQVGTQQQKDDGQVGAPETLQDGYRGLMGVAGMVP